MQKYEISAEVDFPSCLVEDSGRVLSWAANLYRLQISLEWIFSRVSFPFIEYCLYVYCLSLEDDPSLRMLNIFTFVSLQEL